jgi:Secretin and TonB N terminus short domain
MRLAIALGLVCAALWGSVRSDEPAIYTLHIESQPLDGALQEFARQTGMQILFFSDITDGLRAAALDGKYTLAVAMSTLLSGSNLRYRLINSRTIQIFRDARRASVPPVPIEVIGVSLDDKIHVLALAD